jgi:hypothetical protein
MQGFVPFLNVIAALIGVAGAVFGLLLSIKEWRLRASPNPPADRSSVKYILGPAAGLAGLGMLVCARLCSGVVGLGDSQGPAPPAGPRTDWPGISNPVVDDSDGAGGATPQPKLSQVKIQFQQQLDKEMEFFVDGKVQQGFLPEQNGFDPPSLQVQLQLPEGAHAIKVHWRGKQVWADQVQVKPADQGVTVVKVPEFDDPAGLGTLVLNFVCPDAHQNQQVDLFIDDTFIEKGAGPGAPGDGRSRSRLYGSGWTGSGSGKSEGRLPPGKHTVTLKKYGIEVYSQTVDVKKPRYGKTFLEVNLVVTGTVLIKNGVPIRPGVYARVTVDNNNPNSIAVNSGKEWPVGTDTLEVTAEPGKRVIYVFAGTHQFDLRIIDTFQVQVEPGKQTVVKMNK